MRWLVLVMISSVAWGAEPVHGRWRRACASEGFSCKPGPCCRGTRCVDGVCRKPEKDWSDGPNPNEPTPDHPRPTSEKKKR
ncbi:MAG: hypothetical protein ACOZQL_28080 [Myxococcota bacterium]